MFWNRKKFVAAPPYMGSAFDCAVRYCEQYETVTHRTDSEIHVQLDVKEIKFSSKNLPFLLPLEA